MNFIEEWAEAEYKDGVSPGAAARQLIRMLGISGQYPTLKKMLEDMLSEANRSSYDRRCILKDFEAAAPVEAAKAKRESFLRNNYRD